MTAAPGFISKAVNSKNRYADLKYLMQYFHQDWVDEHKSSTGVLREFARENPRDIVKRTVQEIQEFIVDNPNPHKANRIVEKLHGNTPYGTPNKTISWLKHAAAVLKRTKYNPRKPKIDDLVSNAKIQKCFGLYLLMCQFDDLWRPVFRVERNVLKHFKKAFSKEDVQTCVADIKRILKSNLANKDVNLMLRKDFGSFPPYANAREVRPWLLHIAEQLSEQPKTMSRQRNIAAAREAE